MFKRPLYSLVIWLLFVFLFLFLAGNLLFWFYFFQKPIINNDLFYELKHAATLRDVAYDLQSQANLRHPELFYYFSRLKGVDNELKAGEYLLTKGSSINDVLERISRGLVLLHRFSIINGWNFNQVMNALNHNANLSHEISHFSDEAIAKMVGCPYRTLEGLLFPDTYRFTKGTSDLNILLKAYKAMQKKLLEQWEGRTPGLVYQDPYQALVVASMIEKETNVDSERPMIAAIILKRMGIRMHLQIDSTVIYGLGKRYTGDLTHKDMHEDTAYNTYTRYGLPPTPIAMPSLASIQAALHPANTTALFFVSKGDGTHFFSNTLKEHSRAVTVYQSKGNDSSSSDSPA